MARVHLGPDRPHAGILVSSGLFFRHRSNGTNYHRGRANTISTALLCYDFLDRDVIVDSAIDLSDPDVVADAVVENPACASCHQALDPLASFLWGVAPINVQAITEYPIRGYRAQREGLWQVRTGRPPALFGLPGDDLADLGRMIADDPRFSLCAAERFYSFLARVAPEDVSHQLLAELQGGFIESGYSAKQLARAIVLSDGFRVSHGETEAGAGVIGFKKARPEQLGRMFEDLTGFRWEARLNRQIGGAPYGVVDLNDNDILGFRVLAGGIDSFFVTRPAYTVNTTASLHLRTLAREAAAFAVQTDLAESDPARRRLLTRVATDTADEATVRVQLAELHLRLYGEDVAAESPEVDDSYALFRQVHELTNRVDRAWLATLTGMFQDFRIAFY